MSYVIFAHGGKQYKAKVGDELRLDKMSEELAKPKSDVVIESVLALSDGKDLKVGTPYIKGASVVLRVVNFGKDKKVVIYKKRRRKDSKLKKGFRREFTRVLVQEIKQ